MSGIEIDRYAMIGFYGVRKLVNKIGGVDVDARPSRSSTASCTCA